LAKSVRNADLDADWWTTAVAHHHGVTRRKLRRWMRNAADVDASQAQAAARIAQLHGVQLPSKATGEAGAADWRTAFVCVRWSKVPPPRSPPDRWRMLDVVGALALPPPFTAKWLNRIACPVDRFAETRHGCTALI
jgi:hypothetical protein